MDQDEPRPFDDYCERFQRGMRGRAYRFRVLGKPCGVGAKWIMAIVVEDAIIAIGHHQQKKGAKEFAARIGLTWLEEQRRLRTRARPPPREIDKKCSMRALIALTLHKKDLPDWFGEVRFATFKERLRGINLVLEMDESIPVHVKVSTDKSGRVYFRMHTPDPSLIGLAVVEATTPIPTLVQTLLQVMTSLRGEK